MPLRRQLSCLCAMLLWAGAALAEPAARYLALDALLLRQAPSPSAPIIGDVAQWRSFSATPSADPAWMQLELDGATGFIPAARLGLLGYPAQSPAARQARALPGDERFVPADPSLYPYSSVVKVVVSDPAMPDLVRRCSGFLIGHERLVATAGHCLSAHPQARYTVHLVRGKGFSEEIKASVVAQDTRDSDLGEDADWALLRLARLPHADVAPLQLANASALRGLGEVEALVLGFSIDLDPVKEAALGWQVVHGNACRVSAQNIQLRELAQGELQLHVRVPNTDCRQSRGDSGGPMLVWNRVRGQYELIGITTSARLRPEVQRRWYLNEQFLAAVQSALGTPGNARDYLAHFGAAGLPTYRFAQYSEPLSRQPAPSLMPRYHDLRRAAAHSPAVAGTLAPERQQAAAIGTPLQLPPGTPQRRFALDDDEGLVPESVWPGYRRTLLRLADSSAGTPQGEYGKRHLAWLQRYLVLEAGGDLFLLERADNTVLDVLRQWMNLGASRGNRFFGLRAPFDLSSFRNQPPDVPRGVAVISPDAAWAAIEAGLARRAAAPLVLDAGAASLRLPTAQGVPASLAPAAPRRTIITYCRNPDCWDAYTLARELAAQGHQDVRWMRDGLDGWIMQGLPLVQLAETLQTKQASESTSTQQNFN